MEDNVVAVQVDVDESPNLVQEYGVPSVPFDVIITPSGRVVAKRSSPRDASAYADMIGGLSKVIHGLAGGNRALGENLDQLKNQFPQAEPIVENKSFAPAMPVHRAPLASLDSAELKRKSRIINPYAVAQESLRRNPPQKQQSLQQGLAARSPAATGLMNSNEFASKPISVPKPASVDNVFAAAKQVETVNVTAAHQKSNRENVADLTTFGQPRGDLASRKSMSEYSSQFESQITPAISPTRMNLQGVEAEQFAVNSPGFELPLVDAADTFQANEADLGSNVNSFDVPKISGTRPTTDLDNLSRANADVKISLHSPSNEFQKPVSASLVVPKPKLVMDAHFFREEPAKQSLAAAADAQIVIEPSANDMVSTAKSPVQTATHSQSTDSEAAISLPDNVALHGKCPITLLKNGTWVDGDLKWGCVHRDRTYLFADEAKLREFQKDPDANSPLLAGYDPVVFHNSGELIDGDENHGVFMGKSPNQRVVLFSSAKTRAEFEANPRNYIETIRQAMQSTGGSSSKLLR